MEGWEEEIFGQSGMEMYILLYFKWMTHRVLLWGAGNLLSAGWIHVCARPSPSAAHVKLSQHSQSAILQYKIRFLKKY